MNTVNSIIAAIAISLAVAASSANAVENDLKQMSGRQLLDACDLLTQPLHSPPPGVYDTQNAALVSRVVASSGSDVDRRVSLSYVRFTITSVASAKTTLVELGKRFDVAGIEERDALVSPLAMAMSVAADVSAYDKISAHLMGQEPTKALNFDDCDLLFTVGKHPEHGVVYAKRIYSILISGQLTPLAIPGALRLISHWAPGYEKIDLLADLIGVKRVLSAAERKRVISESFGIFPAECLSSLTPIILSDEDARVADAARALIFQANGASRFAVDPDLWFVALVKAYVFEADMDVAMLASQRKAIVSFYTNEARVGIASAQRIQSKGHLLSIKAIEFLAGNGVPRPFLAAIGEK